MERYREKFINLRTKFNKEANAIAYSDASPEEKQKKLQALNDKFDEDTQSLQDSLQPTERKTERAPAQQAKPAAADKSGHKVGETRTFAGHTWRYKGGDWDSRDSWEAMQ